MTLPSFITPTTSTNMNHHTAAPTTAHHQNPHHPIRARHTIRLSSIQHNFNIVSSAANKQKCSVIVVVKADGYGHGSIETALHLADYCGADAFAVATLEEGIALRKAFMDTNTNTTIGLNFNHTNAIHKVATTGQSTMPLSLFTPPHSIEIKSVSDVSSLSVSIMTGRNKVSSSVANGTTTSALTTPITTATTTTRKKVRSNHIRIVVLGPPTDLPNDFNLYLHYNIEATISSTKMARALMEWVADCDSRKIAEVDQVANERKQELVMKKEEEEPINAAGIGGCIGGGVRPGQSATLTALEGQALGKEVKAILNKAKDAAAVASADVIVTQPDTASKAMNDSGTNGLKHETNRGNLPLRPHNNMDLTQKSASSSSTPTPFPFKGIEDIAKESRTRELAAAKLTAHFTGEGGDDDDNINNESETNLKGIDNESRFSRTTSSTSSSFNMALNEDNLNDGAMVSTVCSAVANAAIAAATSNAMPIKARKKIRWHALIDSGMGRLGFKSVEDEDEMDLNNEELDCVSMFAAAKIGPDGGKKLEKWKEGPHKDTVSIIKAMCHAEIDGAPIEFHGMCTHMAEASSHSSYTNEQMTRFKSLLKRVRQANVSVPTISTDNSSALLTSNLTHFDPVELLSQPNVDTRGYVRTGGAVYGQRPAFTNLRAVSTLTASVRHVATLMKGETVGYDRAYKAEKSVRIATLSIGFADGYPREMGNGKGKVSIRGKTFPIAGNVCMDMLMVDLGCEDELCDAGALVSIGDTAYLWGPEAGNDGEGDVRLQDIANILNTTQSALTCGLDKIRVQRQYVD